MKRKEMRGQAALEYMMTYGWAILLLIIVVGALISSGALTPSYFVSEECYLGPNLPCNFVVYKEFATDANTNIIMNISNGFPYTIKITKLDITLQEDSAVTGGLDSNGITLGSGSSNQKTIVVPYNSNINSMARFRVDITYSSCARELLGPNGECSENHEISGRIVGRVLEKTQ
ncbi:MAG: hypothetical protein WCT31_01355 [Candidatus Micrarchaeia archaeon]|jgi:hypothetical protein